MKELVRNRVSSVGHAARLPLPIGEFKYPALLDDLMSIYPKNTTMLNVTPKEVFQYYDLTPVINMLIKYAADFRLKTGRASSIDGLDPAMLVEAVIDGCLVDLERSACQVFEYVEQYSGLEFTHQVSDELVAVADMLHEFISQYLDQINPTWRVNMNYLSKWISGGVAEISYLNI